MSSRTVPATRVVTFKFLSVEECGCSYINLSIKRARISEFLTGTYFPEKLERMIRVELLL